MTSTGYAYGRNVLLVQFRVLESVVGAEATTLHATGFTLQDNLGSVCMILQITEVIVRAYYSTIGSPYPVSALP